MSEAPLAVVPPPDWRGQFVEAMSGLVLVHGTPRAWLRVLGFMVVCEPDEQPAANIQAALGLSAGTVSVAVRGLANAGLLERITRPGDRRIYHRINLHGWERVLETRFCALTEIRELADQAIAASGGDDPRLTDMRDTMARVEEGVRALLRQGHDRSAAVGTPGPTPIRGNG